MNMRYGFRAAAVFLAAALLLGGCEQKNVVYMPEENYTRTQKDGCDITIVKEPYSMSWSGVVANWNEGGDVYYWFNSKTGRIEQLEEKTCEGVYTLGGTEYPFSFDYYITPRKPDVLCWGDNHFMDAYKTGVKDTKLSYDINTPILDNRYAFFQVTGIGGKAVWDLWLVDLSTGKLVEEIGREGADDFLLQEGSAPVYAYYAALSPDEKWMTFYSERWEEATVETGIYGKICLRNRKTGEEYPLDYPDDVRPDAWLDEETLCYSTIKDGVYHWYLYNVRTDEEQRFQAPHSHTSDLLAMRDSLYCVDLDSRELVDIVSGERQPLNVEADTNFWNSTIVKGQGDRLLLNNGEMLYVYQIKTGKTVAISRDDLNCMGIFRASFYTDDCLALTLVEDKGSPDGHAAFIQLD